MITKQLFAKIFLGTKRALRERFIDPINRICPKYGINTKLRLAAFLATGGIETDYLRTTTEYASGSAYEGREDLGNTQKGDGQKFKGHGFFQTTGRYNHCQVTKATFDRLGIDFEQQPKRLAEIEIAIESACIFWRDNNLAKYADRGDFFAVSGIVNRGNPKLKALHYDKRLALYEICLKQLPADFSFDAPEPVVATNPPAVETEPVVLTPTEPKEDFLSQAFDKNVSADEVKAFAKEKAPSLFGTIARPVAWLFAALKAGNVYVWLGVIAALIFIAIELYIYRDKIKRLWERLKAKFTS